MSKISTIPNPVLVISHRIIQLSRPQEAKFMLSGAQETPTIWSMLKKIRMSNRKKLGQENSAAHFDQGGFLDQHFLGNVIQKIWTYQ